MNGTRRRGTSARPDSGNSAVEFALVAPVLLVIVLGTMVFGLYFGVAHSVQQLASEAARAAVPGLTEQERGALARRFVAESIGSYGLLRASSLTVTAAFDPADPDLFRVTLVYDASGLGLSLFAALLPVPIERVERRAVVRRGGA